MQHKSVEDIITIIQEEKDAVQRAKLIHYLHREKTLSLKEISTKLNLHSSYISHYMRILQLPSIVLDGYYAKQISSAHLFILSRLKNEDEIVKAYERILAQNLTSAQTEELIREIKFTISTTDKQLSKEEKTHIIEHIKEVFPDIEVKIVQTRVKGKIIFELKGETEKTSEFIKQIEEKLTYEEEDVVVLE